MIKEELYLNCKLFSCIHRPIKRDIENRVSWCIINSCIRQLKDNIWIAGTTNDLNIFIDNLIIERNIKNDKTIKY